MKNSLMLFLGSIFFYGCFPEYHIGKYQTSGGERSIEIHRNYYYASHANLLPGGGPMYYEQWGKWEVINDTIILTSFRQPRTRDLVDVNEGYSDSISINKIVIEQPDDELLVLGPIEMIDINGKIVYPQKRNEFYFEERIEYMQLYTALFKYGVYIPKKINSNVFNIFVKACTGYDCHTIFEKTYYKEKFLLKKNKLIYLYSELEFNKTDTLLFDPRKR